MGYREFFSLTFKVTPDVLIPRPETEVLVEEALKHLREIEGPVTVVDVGTGSGCIILAIVNQLVSEASKKDLEHITFVATDVDVAALNVARSNAMALTFDMMITFLVGCCVIQKWASPVAPVNAMQTFKVCCSS